MKNIILINEIEYKSKLILQLEKDNYFRNYYLLYTEQGQFLYLKESNEPGEDPEEFLILKNWEDLRKDINKMEVDELTKHRKYWWESISSLAFYNLIFAHADYKDKIAEELIRQAKKHDPDTSRIIETEALQLSESHYMEKCA